MATWVWIFITFIICQRVVELLIANRNEKWMKRRGGVEVGNDHYKWFILLHTLFFIALAVEIVNYPASDLQLNYYLLLLFILTQAGRVWCIYTLGRFWNTKIIILPSVALITKGPYKYIKHPNYLIVGIELLIIPLVLGAYITAIAFPMLHILLLKIRIPAENKALNNKAMPT